MKFDTSILREADIRGIYPEQITVEFAFRLGKVFGTFALNNNQKQVVVGHDNRFGGPILTKKLIDGLISTGINVSYIGLVTTPMLNYASRELKIEYGIMVTASHNPSRDNGFKLFGRNYQHCDYDELEIIYNNLQDKNFKANVGDGVIDYLDISDKYAEFVASSINPGNKKMRVVVDCGNGTGSVIIKEIYEKLPFETIFLFCESDPSFPNHHPDPNVKANLVKLSEAVKHYHADLGLAYDGDADRCGFVDNKGNIIEADLFMALMCEDILNKTDNKTVLIDVKCSKALEDEILRCGGNIYVETPSSALQERVMLKKNIIFGGGYSNHIFFRDRHPGYDDGIYAGLRAQEMLNNQDKTFNELAKKLNKYYNTEEIKISIPDNKKQKIVEEIKKYCDDKSIKYSTVDGIKAYIGESWALIRASNTGPNLTLRFESTTEKELNKVQKQFMDILNNLAK